jgi:hypothetical protein
MLCSDEDDRDVPVSMSIKELVVERRGEERRGEERRGEERRGYWLGMGMGMGMGMEMGMEMGMDADGLGMVVVYH